MLLHRSRLLNHSHRPQTSRTEHQGDEVAKSGEAAVVDEDEGPCLEQLLLSFVPTNVNHPELTTYKTEYTPAAEPPPTSWSFAATQRLECSRIVRSFRMTRQRLRQELRGLAIKHAESLLSAVRRNFATSETGGGNITGRRSNGHGFLGGTSVTNGVHRSHRHWRGQETGRGQGIEVHSWPSAKSKANGMERFDEESAHLSNLRHEARPQPAGDTRWALAVDEEEMGRISTISLEASSLEGSGVNSRIVKQWREDFRKRVSRIGGSRHPRDLAVLSRYVSTMDF